MQVSSRSWHMWLTRKAFGPSYEPKNLCGHFWTTIAAMPMLLFIGITIAAVGIITAILFIGSIFIYGTRAKAAFFDNVKDVGPWWRRSEKKSNQTKSHEPNLFIEWIKAKKQKVCPLITVVEPEEN